jgi:AraC family transcriptional regulator
MIEISEFPNRVLLGLSRPFVAATQPNSNAAEVIGPLWQEMSKLFFSMELNRDPSPLGVGAMSLGESVDEGSMIYFAGYEVHSVPDVLNGLEVLVLEPAKYAFITHEGPMTELPGVITNFYSKLLPESGLPRRDGMDLEIYLETYDPEPKTIVTIAAPVH